MDSQYVDLSDVVTSTASHSLDQTFYETLARTLAHEVEACGDRVPVITGRQGSASSQINNLMAHRLLRSRAWRLAGQDWSRLHRPLCCVGRGRDPGRGVAGLERGRWHLYCRSSKSSHRPATVDHQPGRGGRAYFLWLRGDAPRSSALGIAHQAQVIHPFTMEQVVRARIPIRIKNVMNPRGNGTVILPDSLPDLDVGGTEDLSRLFRQRSAKVVQPQQPKRPTAVTIKHQILVINVHSNKRSLSHGFFAKIFSTLDKWRLSVDLISTSEVHVSMALHSEAALLSGGGEHELKTLDQDLRGAIGELRDYGTVDIIPGMAILSLVGKQMKNMIGIAGRMFSTLGENNVNIEMISQGASEINISCVIEERDADRAINILHTNLFTFLD